MDHFFLLGDMGSGDPEQYRVGERMYEKIKELNKKDVFVCGLGDNIYERGWESIDDPQFISKFEKPYEKISNDVKFYMCLGNHDYGHNLDLTNNAKSLGVFSSFCIILICLFKSLTTPAINLKSVLAFEVI